MVMTYEEKLQKKTQRTAAALLSLASDLHKYNAGKRITTGGDASSFNLSKLDSTAIYLSQLARKIKI